MAWTISTAHNEARLTATRDHLDKAATPARVLIYGGTRPTNGAATLETLLANVVLDKPCGTVAAGKLTITASAISLALATGDATWGRLVDGDGQIEADGDVSTLADGTGQIQLDDTHLLAGGRVLVVLAELS